VPSRAAIIALFCAAVVAVVWWPFDDPGFDRYHLPRELWLTGCALAVALGARSSEHGRGFHRLAAYRGSDAGAAHHGGAP
jgi:hypothetical protein